MRRKLSYQEIFGKRPTLAELQAMDRTPIYALVENIRSMHNVGSIFRTSDGIRLARLYLTGYTARPPRREIDKTALGSTDSVPWEYHRDPLPVIDDLKSRGIRIVAVEHTSDSIDYARLTTSFPMCVVMGNEVDGVSQEIVKKADQTIEIPMLGLKQSLNVSVAFGVVIYSLLERYRSLIGEVVF
jgi:tRNA G18 (ribose-2'-O)-methylase SpoU